MQDHCQKRKRRIKMYYSNSTSLQISFFFARNRNNFFNVFGGAEFKIARQNGISGQVFEKNGVETPEKRVFLLFFENSYKSDVQKILNRAQIKT